MGEREVERCSSMLHQMDKGGWCQQMKNLKRSPLLVLAKKAMAAHRRMPDKTLVVKAPPRIEMILGTGTTPRVVETTLIKGREGTVYYQSSNVK